MYEKIFKKRVYRNRANIARLMLIERRTVEFLLVSYKLNSAVVVRSLVAF